MKHLIVSLGAIILLLSFIISCDKSLDDSTVIQPETTKTTQNIPTITATNQYGIHTFDISNLENGDYSNFSGFLTINDNLEPARISLPDSYISSLCYERKSKEEITIKDKNTGEELHTITMKNVTENSLTFDFLSNNLSTSFVISNSALANIFDSLPIDRECDANGQSRWIPFAMAAVAAAATIACAIANSNASSNCQAVANACVNGVASYEFEGGTCGNGDCDVVCN